MTGFSRRAVAAHADLLRDVTAFYAHEAWLLDTREYEAWLDLLADDLDYRVMIAENVAARGDRPTYLDGPLDVSWMHEGKELVDARVRQILTGFHWAEEPPSRTVHVVSNVAISGEPSPDGVVVQSAIVVHRNRNESEEDTFLARREDLLRPVDDGFLVARRRVWLTQTVLRAKNLTAFF